MGHDTITTSNTRSRKLVVAGGLGLVLVAALVRWSAARPSRAAAAGPPVAPAEVKMAVLDAAASGSPAAVIDWPLKARRDPFYSERVLPPATRPAPATPVPAASARDSSQDLLKQARAGITLRGTITGKEPQAFINGAMYRVGDVVSGFRILRIEARQIVIERDGAALVVQMP